MPKYCSIHVGWEGDASWLGKMVPMDCVESGTYGSKVPSEIGRISMLERRTQRTQGACSRRVVIQLLQRRGFAWVTLVISHGTQRRKAMSFIGITGLYPITGGLSIRARVAACGCAVY